MVFGILDGKKKGEADDVCSDLDNIHDYRDEVVDELLNRLAELDNEFSELDKVQKVTIRKIEALVAAKQNAVNTKKGELSRLQAKLDGAREAVESPTTQPKEPEEEEVQPSEQTPVAEPTSPAEEADDSPKIVVMIFNDGVGDELIKKQSDLCEGWINRYHINKEKVVKLTARPNLFGIRTKAREAGLIHKLNIGCLFVAGSKEELKPIVDGMCRVE